MGEPEELAEGLAEGHVEGCADGHSEGRADGLATEATRTWHARLGHVSFGVMIKMLEKNLKKMMSWRISLKTTTRRSLVNKLMLKVRDVNLHRGGHSSMEESSQEEEEEGAEKEALLWQEAQIELHVESHSHLNFGARSRVRDISQDSNYSGFRCFGDGSWKESDQFSGLGWCGTSSSGESPTVGAANIHRSLCPLHTEVEALLWAMKCMIGADNQEVAFFTDCSDLVKMVSSPTEWPAFTVYLEELQSDKDEFTNFSLSLISRSANVKVDNLARKIRTE
ncbi:Ribonuclease H domain [Arabidopsis suecica]|uniref:Ribonuclease H domain n=1 Tax=Arabidopsis suecica TaxID=45249 RepID=A0A8T2G1X6_ARASU|nr:Ribonuclease H domain [Arabidopsis suecica]